MGKQSSFDPMRQKKSSNITTAIASQRQQQRWRRRNHFFSYRTKNDNALRSCTHSTFPFFTLGGKSKLSPEGKNAAFFGFFLAFFFRFLGAQRNLHKDSLVTVSPTECRHTHRESPRIGYWWKGPTKPCHFPYNFMQQCTIVSTEKPFLLFYVTWETWQKRGGRRRWIEIFTGKRT